MTDKELNELVAVHIAKWTKSYDGQTAVWTDDRERKRLPVFTEFMGLLWVEVVEEMKRRGWTLILEDSPDGPEAKFYRRGESEDTDWHSASTVSRAICFAALDVSGLDGPIPELGSRDTVDPGQ